MTKFVSLGGKDSKWALEPSIKMFRFIKDKLAWLRFLKEDNLGKRVLVGFCILIALFAFIHFRDVKIEVPEIGSTAKKYVVAQVDFDFPDEEGSMILRQESSKDIEAIYRVSLQAIESRWLEFEDFLVTDQAWRNLFPSNNFEQIHRASVYIKEVLTEVRLTDRRTLSRLEAQDIDTKYYFLLPSSFNGTSVRFSSHFWLDIQEMITANHRHESAVIAYALNFFQVSRWPVQQDRKLQNRLRQEVGERVPSKWTRVEEGKRIMDTGDTVTPRHIVMLNAMRTALIDSNRLWAPFTILGSLMFALITTLVGVYYFRRHQQAFVRSVSKLSLYATLVILTLIIAKVSEYFMLRSSGLFTDMLRYPLFIPFVAILITALLGTEIAIFTTAFLTVVMGLTLAVDHSRFISVNLLAGFASILFSGFLRKRKQVFTVCAKVWVLCVLLFFCYNLESDRIWTPVMAGDITSALLFMVFTSILVVGLLPVLESLFHVMTDITLMEFMDPNNELLRRLSIEAPGTYQHCLVVGSIAEAAAQAIGANGLFCRVSTLYHDIGKLLNPHYFTENQMGGFNIHQLLTPVESAQVIISHVKEGEALAKKHSLPKSFIDVILEHHGTTMVYYFYCKQIELMGGDESAVDEKAFRYPGPKPHTKESAIIMMADTVEAASRSLEDVNEQTLFDLIDRLIGEKLEDGQFDECQLTFEEFGKIKRTMVKNLALARHIRIKYPEKKAKTKPA